MDDETCTGVGPNKKLAKRHAAEAMLLHLGYNKPSPQPAKPAIKMANDSTNGDKKVHFVENSEESGKLRLTTTAVSWCQKLVSKLYTDDKTLKVLL